MEHLEFALDVVNLLVDLFDRLDELRHLFTARESNLPPVSLFGCRRSHREQSQAAYVTFESKNLIKFNGYQEFGGSRDRKRARAQPQGLTQPECQ